MDENAKSLRFIGVVVIVGELAWAAFRYWSMQLVVGEFSSAELTFQSEFIVRTPVIVAGLVLLIVAEVFREGIRMRADLETAREIQFSLVAAAQYENEGVLIHSRMQPATIVGGDYYDIIELGGGGSRSSLPTWRARACQLHC